MKVGCRMSELVCKIIGVVIGLLIVSVLLALPVKWAWNVTMPYLFSLPVITAGKAWCLMFLSQMLLKSTVSTE